LGMPYWSLSKFLKFKVKGAVNYVGNFEEAVAREARKRNVHGVVCGHIHHAEIRQIDGMLYCNDGDWVESMTALVEHYDGRLEILDHSAYARHLESAVVESKFDQRLDDPGAISKTAAVSVSEVLVR